MNQRNKRIEQSRHRIVAYRRQYLLLGVPLTLALCLAMPGWTTTLFGANPWLSPVLIFAVISIAVILTVFVRLQIAFAERAELEIDNTVLRSMLHALNVKANYDGLTGLPNVRLLPDRFNEALVRAKRAKTYLALYTVKLDDFGEINARHGNEAGTRAVKVTADRLKSTLRGTDSVVRLGSSHFVLLVEAINELDELEYVNAKLTKVLGRTLDLGTGDSVRAHDKVAMAIYPNDGDTLDALLSKANHDMETGQTLARAIEQQEEFDWGMRWKDYEPLSDTRH